VDIATAIFIAFALAADAFAASITSGVMIKRVKINSALKIAFFFGFFQMFMPLIGWLTGLSLQDPISNFDHWAAFGILSFIGGKMIYASCRKENNLKMVNPLNLRVLTALSFATSIDALAVGISFAFLKISIATPIVIIGVITFLLSFLGVHIGDKIGYIFEKKIEILGGVILIGIGIKILLEHLIT
jgi:putative Mn2+ efflux pump MntP